MTADLQLALFRPRGGRRAGAGRKPGPRPRVRHRSRPAITRHGAAHVTLKLRQGLRTLRDVRTVRALEDTFRRGAERGDFRLLHDTIQSDHLHVIVEAWFSGWREGIVTAMARAPAPVAQATSWLPRTGWRRHGLVDPNEVPGLPAG